MKIVIIGCGGHGRVILDIHQNRDEYQIAGFLLKTMINTKLIQKKLVY